MEPEAFIKLEEQSPIESTSNIMGLCMAHFYDDDSVDPICMVKQDPFDENTYDHHYVLIERCRWWRASSRCWICV